MGYVSVDFGLLLWYCFEIDATIPGWSTIQYQIMSSIRLQSTCIVGSQGTLQYIKFCIRDSACTDK